MPCHAIPCSPASLAFPGSSASPFALHVVVCAGMASKGGHWISNKAFDKSMLFEAWRLAGGWLAAGWPGHQTESTFLDSRVLGYADGDYDFTP